ncbi:MAG: YdcH family protein [Alphaproteobacteria bacterium]
MAAAAHLKELENKHASLESELKQELKHPQPDTLRLATLKKQKLHLKEQIKVFQAKV